jgi:hypothetical protein
MSYTSRTPYGTPAAPYEQAPESRAAGLAANTLRLHWQAGSLQAGIDREFDTFQIRRVEIADKFDRSRELPIQDVPGYARGNDIGMAAEFSEAIKLDRLALQKLNAESALIDLAITNSEGLMTTKFEQVAAGAEAVVPAADRAGRAVRQAGQDAGQGGEAATAGWALAVEALDQYAASARDIGKDIGASLVGAFRSAEDAIGNFVKTGKLDFGSLVTSMIADLAKLAARRFILGPLAGVLSGALGSGAVGQALVGVFHDAAFTRHGEHFGVVHAVTKGDAVLQVKAQTFGHCFESMALGDAAGHHFQAGQGGETDVNPVAPARIDRLLQRQ